MREKLNQQQHGSIMQINFNDPASINSITTAFKGVLQNKSGYVQIGVLASNYHSARYTVVAEERSSLAQISSLMKEMIANSTKLEPTELKNVTRSYQYIVNHAADEQRKGWWKWICYLLFGGRSIVANAKSQIAELKKLYPEDERDDQADIDPLTHDDGPGLHDHVEPDVNPPRNNKTKGRFDEKDNQAGQDTHADLQDSDHHDTLPDLPDLPDSDHHDTLADLLDPLDPVSDLRDPNPYNSRTKYDPLSHAGQASARSAVNAATKAAEDAIGNLFDPPTTTGDIVDDFDPIKSVGTVNEPKVNIAELDSHYPLTSKKMACDQKKYDNNFSRTIHACYRTSDKIGLVIKCPPQPNSSGDNFATFEVDKTANTKQKINDLVKQDEYTTLQRAGGYVVNGKVNAEDELRSAPLGSYRIWKGTDNKICVLIKTHAGNAELNEAFFGTRYKNRTEGKGKTLFDALNYLNENAAQFAILKQMNLVSTNMKLDLGITENYRLVQQANYPTLIFLIIKSPDGNVKGDYIDKGEKTLFDVIAAKISPEAQINSLNVHHLVDSEARANLDFRNAKAGDFKYWPDGSHFYFGVKLPGKDQKFVDWCNNSGLILEKVKALQTTEGQFAVMTGLLVQDQAAGEIRLASQPVGSYVIWKDQTSIYFQQKLPGDDFRIEKINANENLFQKLESFTSDNSSFEAFKKYHVANNEAAVAKLKTALPGSYCVYRSNSRGVVDLLYKKLDGTTKWECAADSGLFEKINSFTSSEGQFALLSDHQANDEADALKKLENRNPGSYVIWKSKDGVIHLKQSLLGGEVRSVDFRKGENLFRKIGELNSAENIFQTLKKYHAKNKVDAEERVAKAPWGSFAIYKSTAEPNSIRFRRRLPDNTFESILFKMDDNLLKNINEALSFEGQVNALKKYRAYDWNVMEKAYEEPCGTIVFTYERGIFQLYTSFPTNGIYAFRAKDLKFDTLSDSLDKDKNIFEIIARYRTLKGQFELLNKHHALSEQDARNRLKIASEGCFLIWKDGTTIHFFQKIYDGSVQKKSIFEGDNLFNRIEIFLDNTPREPEPEPASEAGPESSTGPSAQQFFEELSIEQKKASILNRKAKFVVKFNKFRSENETIVKTVVANPLVENTTFIEIYQFFKKLEFKLHPDKGGDQEKFKQLGKLKEMFYKILKKYEDRNVDAKFAGEVDAFVKG